MFWFKEPSSEQFLKYLFSYSQERINNLEAFAIIQNYNISDGC